MVEANESKSSGADQPKVQPIGPNDPPARPGTNAFKVLGSRFELPLNYEIIDPVGSGAYGVVVAARDKNEAEPNNLVAIKKSKRHSNTRSLHCAPCVNLKSCVCSTTRMCYR